MTGPCWPREAGSVAAYGECVGGPWDGDWFQHGTPGFAVSASDTERCDCDGHAPACGWYVWSIGRQCWVFSREIDVSAIER